MFKKLFNVKEGSSMTIKREGTIRIFVLVNLLILIITTLVFAAEEVTLSTILPRRRDCEQRVTVAWDASARFYDESVIPARERDIENRFFEPTGGNNMQPMRIYAEAGEVIRLVMAGTMRGQVYGQIRVVNGDELAEIGRVHCLGNTSLLTGLQGRVVTGVTLSGEDLNVTIAEPGLEWRPFCAQRVDRALVDGVFEYKLMLYGNDFHTQWPGASGPGHGARVRFHPGRVAVLEIIRYEATP